MVKWTLLSVLFLSLYWVEWHANYQWGSLQDAKKREN